METPPAVSPVKLTRTKLLIFRAVAVTVVGVAGVFFAEAALRWQQRRVGTSDRLEPGMVRYDAQLGWSLTPGWTGGHRHHDFSVSYHIDSEGFRREVPVDAGAPGGPITLVLGDSFTFGLGVNDDATFVHLLQAARVGGARYVSNAVPGYSTDQESLLLEQRMPVVRPARVLLVVYLGNDLFDNVLPFPLQVSSAKPYAAVNAGRLEIRNVPVPQERKPREALDLLGAVWGPEPAQWPWRVRAEQHSELWRLLSQSVVPEPDHRESMRARYAPALAAFDLLLERIAGQCARHQIGLTVVTLAGQSYVKSPRSVSAQYQDVCREHVLATATKLGIGTIDVATLMRERYSRESGDWFHPHDGHLTVAGHQVVAALLEQTIPTGK